MFSFDDTHGVSLVPIASQLDNDRISQADARLPRIERVRTVENAGAILAICSYSLFIFREHVFGSSNFIGDSDRLETFLNIKIFELKSILNLGRIPVWNEFAFTGFPTHSLPWMLPGFDPLVWIVSLFPINCSIYLFGLLSIFWYFLAGVAAYFFFKKECRDAVTAVVAAILYLSSYIAVLRIAQVDNAFFVVILVPLGMLAIRKMANACKSENVLSFIVVVTILLGLSFLQEAAYAILLFGLYAIYLCGARGGLGASSFLDAQMRLRFLACFSLAIVLAILIAFPRLATVAIEFSNSARPSNMARTEVYEIFRWLHDGIFGRFPEEVTHREFIGDILNVHEGLQIFTSTFVPLLVLTGLAIPRNHLARIGGIALYVVVLMALLLQLNNMSWLFIVGASLVLCLLTWSMIRVRQPYEQFDDDVGFYAFVTSILLALILFQPARAIIYYVFLKQQFQHSRLSEITSLTVLCLVAAFLKRASGGDGALTNFVRLHWRSVILGIVFGVVFGFIRGRIEESTLLSKVALDYGSLRIASIPIVQIALCMAIYGTLLVGYLHFWGHLLWQQRIVFTLAVLMIVDAGSYVAFQVRGPEAHRYPIPFENNSLMMAPSRAFRPPDASTQKAIHQKLEVNEYRSVVVVDARLFGSQPASFLAQFWQLRLVDGYSPAVPLRLASMPWQGGAVSGHSIKFNSLDRLNWQLLAFLNVKYAIIADLGLFYNLRNLADDAPYEVNQLQVTENPYSATPRAFFAQRIEPVKFAVPAEPNSGLVTNEGVKLPTDPRMVSVVEGLEMPSDFAGGDITAVQSYGDRLVVRFPAADVDRFLVLNELYAPGWTAETERGPVPVLPTNVVMRGARAAAGVTSMTFVYRSRLYSLSFLALSAIGVLGTLALWLWLSFRKRSSDIAVSN